MDGLLRAHWTEAWCVLGLEAPAGLLDRVLAAYAGPQRHYHGLQHLAECLGHFGRERGAAAHPAEVALALFFHDAVYDVHAADNEARSAGWARDTLQEAGASAETADRVHALVMATCHDAQPEGADAQLLVDIDLAILGAAPERFAEYERQIRREYAHVPPEAFEPRRRAILGRFLARGPLYLTPGLRARCEAQARSNLRAAIGPS